MIMFVLRYYERNYIFQAMIKVFLCDTYIENIE